jgi:hypothetical protein
MAPSRFQKRVKRNWRWRLGGSPVSISLGIETELLQCFNASNKSPPRANFNVRCYSNSGHAQMRSKCPFTPIADILGRNRNVG